MSDLTATKPTRDVVRWDALDSLSERLADLAEQVEELRDRPEPGRLTVMDAPENAKMVRRYFDALDEIGWYSEEQLAAAGLKPNGEGFEVVQ